MAEVAPPLLTAPLLVRTALLDRLDGILGRPLTLVTAPAGYGKSTLAAQWCADPDRCPVPTTWWTVSDPSELERLADLDGDGEPHVVVVDGIEGPGATAAMAALAARNRGKAHLLVLSRAPLGPDLASLRLDGRLDVLHERDLRVQPAELAHLVELHTGSAPPASLARAVCEELDGWMAGAVLLALDWDPSTTIEDHRSRLDAGYRSSRTILTATVADAVGPELLADLREVVCLPELHPDLIDALTGREAGQRLVQALQQAGAFVRPSDLAPDGLRLHPLARSGLRDGRAGRTSAETATLQAAAAWCEQRNLPLLGAVCLIELGEHEEAFALVQANLLDLLAADRLRDLGRVAAMIPGSVLQRHFTWMVSLAWLTYEANDTGMALTIIAAAQRAATPPQMISSSAVNTLAAARLEDPTPILDAAEHALILCEEVGEDDVDYEDLFSVSRTAHWRTWLQCGALYAAAYLGAWDRAARHDLEIGATVSVEIPALALMVHRGRRVTYLAMSGRLAAAEHEARTALALAPAHDIQVDRISHAVYYGLAESVRNRFRFDEAIEHLDACLERSRASHNANLTALATATLASLHNDLGRPDEARRALADHDASGHRPPRYLAGMLAAAEGRALLLEGSAAAARQVLNEAPLVAPVATALVLGGLERGDVVEVDRLVSSWPDEPTVTGRVHHALAAAALGEMRGDRRAAQAHLRPALEEAARHGLHLPVRDYGVHVLHLLRAEARDHRDAPAAAALAEQVAGQLDRTASVAIRLTPRERLVLNHLGDTSSLPELAERLRVSRNTIKSQLRSIYRKLGVSSRKEAVQAWRSSLDDDTSDAG